MCKIHIVHNFCKRIHLLSTIHDNKHSPFLHYPLVPSFKKSILEIQVTRTPLRGVSGYLFFQYLFLSAGNLFRCKWE